MRLVFILFIFLSIVFTGCSSLRQFDKKLVGVSEIDLKSKETKQVQIVEKDVAFCWASAIETVSALSARVYAKDRKKLFIIAIDFSGSFPSYCIDTTPVGIFFKTIGEGKTQVEVASYNLELEKFVAESLK